MSKTKIYFFTLITNIFIFLFSVNAFSAPYVNLKLTYDGKTVKYNSEKVYLQVNSNPVQNLPLEPIILNSYTLVPAREVFEKLGADVTWLKDSSQVQVVYQDKVVLMKINDLNATVNGNLLQMNIPPKLINAKTMIPVRFVSESVGLIVNWDSKSRIINIIEPPIQDTTTETTTITTTTETTQPQTSNIITLQSIDMPDSDERTFAINANDKIEKFEQKILEDGSVAIDIFNSMYSISQTSLDSVSEFVSNVTIENIGDNTTRFIFKTKNSVLNNNFLSKDGKTLFVNFGGNPIKNFNVYNDGNNDIITIFGDFTPVAKVLKNDENNNLVINIENASLVNTTQNIKETSLIKSVNTEGSTNTNVNINLELNEEVKFSTKEDENSISFAFFKDENLNNNPNNNIPNDNNNNNSDNINTNVTSTRQFKIPKNTNIPININAIKHTDNYLNKQYILTFDTDITSMLNLGVHYVNNDLVNTITVENIGSTTQLLLDCKKITAINITEDAENIYINMLLPKEKYKAVVVIDPGHGGGAPGTSGNGLVEKDINLKIALKLNALFETNPNIKAYFTRLEDVNPSFDDRTNMSNEIGDIFVSIHQNAADKNPNANGTEVFYLKPNTAPNGLTSKDLAAIFQKNLLKDLGLLDRKIKTNNYIVLRNNKVPAILCEVGFLSNPSDASKLETDNFQQKAAQSLYNATVEVFEKYPTNR